MGSEIIIWIIFIPLYLYLLYVLIKFGLYVYKDRKKRKEIEAKKPILKTTVSDDDFKYAIYVSGEKEFAILIKHDSFDSKKVLEIPESINGITVLGIEVSAFENDKLIQEIILPDSITTIGKRAFYSGSLRSIRWSKNLHRIGAGAFACSNLSNIVFDFKQNLYVGESAFKMCAFDNLTLTSNVVCDISSFSGIRATNVTLKDDVKVLSEKQFAESKIETVIISSGIRIIPKRCFFNCQSLRKILIPQSVIQISNDAFKYSTITYPRYKSDFTPDRRYNGNYVELSLPKLTVYCDRGSYAQQFARDNGINFRPRNVFFEENDKQDQLLNSWTTGYKF